MSLTKSVSQMSVTNNSSSCLLLNLRGTIFEVEESDIGKFPAGSPFIEEIGKKNAIKIKTTTDFKGFLNSLIYINRNADIFNSIMDYFVNDTLCLPHKFCIKPMLKELQYWGFDESNLSHCCLDRVLRERENQLTSQEVSEQWDQLESKAKLTHGGDPVDRTLGSLTNIQKSAQPTPAAERKPTKKPLKNKLSIASGISIGLKHQTEFVLKTVYKDEEAPTIKMEGNYRGRLEEFLINPQSSLPARVWSFCMLGIIVVSIFTLMLETVPITRYPPLEEVINSTDLIRGEGLFKYYLYNSHPRQWITWVDVFSTLVLTVDFILRLILSKQKVAFMRRFLTITDLFGLLPVWVLIILEIYMLVAGIDINNINTHLHNAVIALEFFRLVRIMRFGHIMYQEKRLKLIGLALKRSWKEIFILMVLLAICSCFFGITMFIVEVQAADSFMTAFHAQWWAIITMTTVGYGDMYPTSSGGYFIGVLCALTGIIIVAMATTILVNNFLITYEHVEKYDRLKQYQAEREKVNLKAKENIGANRKKIAPMSALSVESNATALTSVSSTGSLKDSAKF